MAVIRTETRRYSDDPNKEVCPFCSGEGTKLVRGYQQSIDEARKVECDQCRGTGERPKGTQDAEAKASRKRHLKYLDDEIASLQERRRSL
jgi:DnaJ-class molecular chaperone